MIENMMYDHEIKEEIDEPEDIKMHTERHAFSYNSLHSEESDVKNVTDMNSLLFEGSCDREDDKQAAVNLNDLGNEMNCKHDHTRCIEAHTEVICDGEIVKMETGVPEDVKIKREHRLSYACLKLEETEDKECIFVCARFSSKINCGSEDNKQLNDHRKYDAAEKLYNQDIHSKVTCDCDIVKVELDGPEGIGIDTERHELNYTGLEIGEIEDMESKFTSDNSSRANCGSEDKKRVNAKLDDARIKVDCDDKQRKCDAIESITIICHNNKKEVINSDIEINTLNKTKDSKDSMKISDGEVTMKCVSGTEKQYIDPFATELDCRLKINEKLKLERRLELKHDSSAEWHKCQHCEFETKTKRYLNKHFRLKHDDSAEWYKCEQCGFKAKNKSNLNRHFKLKHDGSAEWYKCEHCEFKTKDKYQVKRHFKFRHDSSAVWYKCEYCELETKYKYQLKRHSKLQHDGIVNNVNLKQSIG